LSAGFYGDYRGWLASLWYSFEVEDGFVWQRFFSVKAWDELIVLEVEGARGEGYKRWF